MCYKQLKRRCRILTFIDVYLENIKVPFMNEYLEPVRQRRRHNCCAVCKGYPIISPDIPRGLQEFEAPRILRHWALEGDKDVSLTHR